MGIPATPADVIDRVKTLAASRRGGTVWIGVDGRGGAGKTTLAAAIAAAVPEAVVIHIDDFAGPRLTTWDRPRFVAQVVEPLLAGRPARYQIWDWDTDSGAGWVDVRPGSVVVAEGVSSTTAQVGVPWALQVWVEAPLEVRLRRALERDGAALLARWVNDWIPSEEAYVAEEHPDQRADLVVDGSGSAA